MNRTAFHDAIDHFLRDVEHCPCEPHWNLMTDSRSGYRYLTRRTSHPLPHGWTPPQPITDSGEVEQEQDMAAAATARQAHATLEHHVVYSPAFRVPVLYFNAFDPDGSALSLDQLYDWIVPRDLEPDIRVPTAASSQGGITQDDHPILGLPFWYIHPCNTQSVIKLFDQHVDTRNYIKIWLSFFGPAAGCRLSSQLFMCGK